MPDESLFSARTRGPQDGPQDSLAHDPASDPAQPHSMSLSQRNRPC